MKKMMMFAALAAVGMVAGCFTSATAYTKKTDKDGTVTESKVKIVGTGDKASQIAAEGLFADGASDDLGAGVKTASASQQSTGVKETLEGMGVLLTGIGTLVAKTQGIPTASARPGEAVAPSTVPEAQGGAGGADIAATADGEADYSGDGYGGSPGTSGEGVYGKPGCSRCRAWLTAHPGSQLIDIGASENKTALWSALRRLGYTGTSVSLPVAITSTGFTQAAK